VPNASISLFAIFISASVTEPCGRRYRKFINVVDDAWSEILKVSKRVQAEQGPRMAELPESASANE